MVVLAGFYVENLRKPVGMSRLAGNVRAITLSDSDAGESRASRSRETKVTLLQLHKKYFDRLNVKESTAGKDPPNDGEANRKQQRHPLMRAG